MESRVFPEASRLVEARRPFVLCTVVSTDRSAPRDAGSRMLVRDDGTFEGTVGGGPLEAMVLLEAKRLLASADAPTFLFEAELTTDGEVHLGMKCGGAVKVLLDVHRPQPRAVVLGAGHVGLKVVEIARAAGWDVLALDDRDDRLALLPDGVPRRKFESDRIAEAFTGTSVGDYVVIVTRCHDIDARALQAALGTPARYIGLIGSRRKIAVVSRDLVASGTPDPQADPRVYAPIGIDLGNKTPGEIALAVVAELVAVRDGKVVPHRRLPRREVGRVVLKRVENDGK